MFETSGEVSAASVSTLQSRGLSNLHIYAQTHTKIFFFFWFGLIVSSHFASFSVSELQSARLT